MRCFPDRTSLSWMDAKHIKQVRKSPREQQIEIAIRLLKKEHQLYFASDYAKLKSPFALSLRSEVVNLLDEEGYVTEEKEEKYTHPKSEHVHFIKGVWIQIKSLKKSK